MNTCIWHYMNCLLSHIDYSPYFRTFHFRFHVSSTLKTGTKTRNVKDKRNEQRRADLHSTHSIDEKYETRSFYPYNNMKWFIQIPKWKKWKIIMLALSRIYTSQNRTISGSVLKRFFFFWSGPMSLECPLKGMILQNTASMVSKYFPHLWK